MTAMFFEGFFDSMTANQIFHAPLILRGRDAHDIDCLFNQIWRYDDNTIPVGDDDIFRIDDDFEAGCGIYCDCLVDGSHLSERTLAQRGLAFGKYLCPESGSENMPLCEADVRTPTGNSNRRCSAISRQRPLIMTPPKPFDLAPALINPPHTALTQSETKTLKIV